jgi:hypothetical protein
MTLRPNITTLIWKPYLKIMEELITTILTPINNRTIITNPIIPNIITVHPCLLITITLLIIPLITTIMGVNEVMLILHVTMYITIIITTS